ncbi:SDR family oxidoreductase [Virgisporangium ochraceum]|uniref:Short-chain dehydrogenase n=1 Tax=Virgisporangium ochraceum TaxID=65505 RepID=A0A8J4E9Z8_9ACTN|nr:SDR family oxidoreductase [Virgisporangium ochraceum]GIJ66853.1 short-chain dehydrogenase [Virgisporangium ochraceum]
MNALRGKAVVVTGAGRGLGAAYATLAAAEGAAVVVNDVDVERAREVVAEIGAAGGRAVADGSDIASWDGAGALVAHCVDAFGAIDGLVNNAGIFRLAGPYDQDPDDFRAVVEVNLLGTAYCGLHAIRAMTRGSIVNVTSGAHAGSADMGAYGASKGGVASLTYCWAVDLAGSGIRVNAVSPNAQTRMAEAFEKHLGEKAQRQNIGKPAEQNAPAVVYLLSDLSASVHGQVVRMDGTELSLIRHPAVIGDGLDDPEWTVEAVAAAFTGELAGCLQPLGLFRA